MNGTIFARHTLNRQWSRWEDRLYHLTPVHDIEGVAVKRDDYFAPMGYGGINGGKVRQLTWLMERLAASGCKGVLYGCSVLSDVSARLALTARHYGLPVHLVLGATHARAAVKHENIAIAVAAGAELRFIKVAYNPQLQRETARLIDTSDYAGWYRLGYGVAVTNEDADGFEGFYRLTAGQVANLPSRRTLIVPAGSCNTAASVIYGLARERPGAVERLVFMQVGPDRRKWLDARLAELEAISEVPIAAYLNDVEVDFYDLHGSGFARYPDKMPWRLGDLDLHPTYEGKVLTYLHRKGMALDGDTTLWVVGSQPTRLAMLDAFQVDGLPVDWAIKNGARR